MVPAAPCVQINAQNSSMSMPMRTRHFLSAFALLAASAGVALAAPVGSSFAYQGRLLDGPDPAQGQYDLAARLFDAASAGDPLSGAVTNLNVIVSNGVFTTWFDFGPGVFTSNACWLQIRVRPSGTGPFALLAPRQAVTATPYALNALSVADGAVTASAIAPGQAVLSVNGLRDGVVLTGTNGVTVTPSGNTLTISGATISGGGWALQGNAGTSPPQDFLGTTDNQPLELRVNNTRFLRAEAGPEGPNLIAGSPANQVLAGASGAVVAGGGQAGEPNIVGGQFSGIGGGRANLVEVDANESAILGGYQNVIYTNVWSAFVGGGTGNYVDSYGDYAVIGGGLSNYVAMSAYEGTIAGGANNYLGQVNNSAIGGGYYNYVDNYADYATVAGGADNWIKTGAPYATIPGGSQAAAISYGQQAYASGMDNEYGDAQASLYVLRAFTTNNAQQELFLDGASERMLVPTNGSWTFQIIIVARTTSGSSACFKAEGGIKNVGGTVSLIGAPTVNQIASEIAGVTLPQIQANNTAQALAIRVTGPNGQRIRWVARVQTAELIF